MNDVSGNPRPGLRELKKQRTRAAISDAALRLFGERGYDAVSVAEIARAAEVSKPTLFKYFPSKEDLVLDRFADHRGESARVVRARPPHLSPLEALHQHFLDGLRRQDAVTGLCDAPQVLALYRLLHRTPALAEGVLKFVARSERELAAALREAAGDRPADLGGLPAAAQILATEQVLAAENIEHMLAGEAAAERLPTAVAEADSAYALLRDGLADYCG